MPGSGPDAREEAIVRPAADRGSRHAEEGRGLGRGQEHVAVRGHRDDLSLGVPRLSTKTLWKKILKLHEMFLCSSVSLVSAFSADPPNQGYRTTSPFFNAFQTAPSDLTRFPHELL